MEKSDLKDVVTKGFTSKWWRDHRASACKGSGVAKAMDKLTQRGVPPTGLPTKTKPEFAADLVPLYTDLLHAFLKASGKCGKFQTETKDALALYRKQTNKGLDMVEKLAQSWDLENGSGKDNDSKAAKAAKAQLNSIIKNIPAIEKAVAPIPKATSQADAALKSLVATYINSIGKEGPDQSAKHLAGLDSVVKTVKLSAHTKNIDQSAKMLAKVISMFQKVDKKAANPKEYLEVAKKLKALANKVPEAQKMCATTAKLYKDSIEDINEARPEGV